MPFLFDARCCQLQDVSTVRCEVNLDQRDAIGFRHRRQTPILYATCVMLTFRFAPLHSDDKLRIGYLTCKICGQNFSTPATSLSQPVDIYHDWVDACEEVNAE